jgi:hypothetical protein
MAVTWVKGTPELFVSSPRRAVEVVEKFDMDALVRDAADMMRLIIATSGTIKSGRSGRIDTARMYDAVKSRVTFSSQSLIGEFGWLDDQELYFHAQDAGFLHVWSGNKIPGMLALADAGIEARQEFIRRLAELFR